ncbi:MAG TPA: uroporphyrinogen decarboxylase family protein, partial [Anaerolineae bacterium]
MKKREVVRCVLRGETPPYVPWSFGFTYEAFEKLAAFYGTHDLEPLLANHILTVADTYGYFDDIGQNRYRDVFGVVWDRSIDKDIGNVRGQLLPAPTLRGFQFPDPLEPRFYSDIKQRIENYGDRFRVFDIGFSLFERAWTLRGMVDLMMDFIDNPAFVHELLNRIADYNIAVVNEACKYEIDAVYFGDDWGQQHGLLMGRRIWKEFIYPVLKRMYSAVHAQGKWVFIHSCGDVDELFDDLVDIGLNCFNPFQPEVMDVYALLKQFRGRLAFHGGMSTQRTLPYGTVADVRQETQRLIAAGSNGGYIFAPAHAVEGDVPLENMLAFIEVMQSQPDYR